MSRNNSVIITIQLINVGIVEDCWTFSLFFKVEWDLNQTKHVCNQKYNVIYLWPGGSRFRRRRLKEDPFKPSHVNHVIVLEADKKEDPRAIVEAFKESENNELASFKRLRFQNIQVIAI